METEIYDIIKKIIYEQSINKLYDDKAEFFEYPIKIDKITFDVLDIFNNLYFNKYKECLIHNAAIYAIEKNDTKYINLFDKNNIDKLINNDRVIRAMITQRAFYNIYSKIKNNQNNDIKIKNNNIELYNKLNRNYKIETLTKKIRQIILNFINNYNNSDKEILLDLILTTDKLDNDLLNYDNFLNIENLKLYKTMLFKIILSDNYLYLKSTEKDISIEYYNEYNEELDEEITDDEDYIENMDKQILNVLENNNLYELQNEELRLILYNNFIIYNVLLSEQKEDYENIKEDKNKIKTLKKINPIYFLDF